MGGGGRGSSHNIEKRYSLASELMLLKSPPPPNRACRKPTASTTPSPQGRGYGGGGTSNSMSHAVANTFFP